MAVFKLAQKPSDFVLPLRSGRQYAFEVGSNSFVGRGESGGGPAQAGGELLPRLVRQRLAQLNQEQADCFHERRVHFQLAEGGPQVVDVGLAEEGRVEHSVGLGEVVPGEQGAASRLFPD